MKDQFAAKTWIFWAQAVIFFPMGFFSFVMAIGFGTGSMKDVRGEVRTDGVVPMSIFGTLMLIVAAIALCKIIRLRPPIIRLYREGIECNLIGASKLDAVPFIPRFFRLLVAIFTGEAYRANIARIAWPDVATARITGLPGMYTLELLGKVQLLNSHETTDYAGFRQAALVDPPQEVADSINHFRLNPAARKSLASWPAVEPD